MGRRLVSTEVSFQWKNPDFLLKNPDFLMRNVDFVLKYVDFIINSPTDGDTRAQGGQRENTKLTLFISFDSCFCHELF